MFYYNIGIISNVFSTNTNENINKGISYTSMLHKYVIQRKKNNMKKH